MEVIITGVSSDNSSGGKFRITGVEAHLTKLSMADQVILDSIDRNNLKFTIIIDSLGQMKLVRK